MPRPTILLPEPEPAEALSVRKLVLETAKFNVLTAHSTREAIDILQMFPNISAAVIVSGDHIDCEKIAQQVRNTTPKLPIVFLTPLHGGNCRGVDHILPSGEPETLVELMRSLLGDPRTME
jgi:DNA-binding response OmpR family regulator